MRKPLNCGSLFKNENIAVRPIIQCLHSQVIDEKEILFHAIDREGLGYESSESLVCFSALCKQACWAENLLPRVEEIQAHEPIFAR